VPALELNDGATVLTQSVAICEWLDETHPEPPLLPGSVLERAHIRAFALAIACDIHPVQNLKVLARLRSMSLLESDVTGWARWIIEDGLAACEALLARTPGPFCFGQTPTLADICLVPQLYNARRSAWPHPAARCRTGLQRAACLYTGRARAAGRRRVIRPIQRPRSNCFSQRYAAPACSRGARAGV
jgi:glutathione S-transferase